MTTCLLDCMRAILIRRPLLILFPCPARAITRSRSLLTLGTSSVSLMKVTMTGLKHTTGTRLLNPIWRHRRRRSAHRPCFPEIASVSASPSRIPTLARPTPAWSTTTSRTDRCRIRPRTRSGRTHTRHWGRTQLLVNHIRSRFLVVLLLEPTTSLGSSTQPTHPANQMRATTRVMKLSPSYSPI